jgi:hypothetical protein
MHPEQGCQIGRVYIGSTFYSLHEHIVFSTKDRRPLIREPWQSDLHAYLGGVVQGLGGMAEIVGGVEDHVQLLGNRVLLLYPASPITPTPWTINKDWLLKA